MNSRFTRLFIGFFSPLFLIAIISAIVNTIMGGFNQGIAIGVLVLYASVKIAGIPTLAYTLLMELLINKKVKNIHAAAFLSGLLGLIVVTICFLFLNEFSVHIFERDPYTPVLGFIIGIVIGYVLKYHYEKTS